MGKVFRFSLIIILLAVVILLFAIFFPENQLANFTKLSALVTLPFLLIVIFIKNFSRKPELNYSNGSISKNWVHTFRLTFQFIFFCSLVVSIAMFVYFAVHSGAGPEGLLPFAVLFLICTPALLISTVFYLIEKH